MRVKCLAQEHNTMSLAKARTRTARSGVERTNHEATAPPVKTLKERVTTQRKIVRYSNSTRAMLLVEERIPLNHIFLYNPSNIFARARLV